MIPSSQIALTWPLLQFCPWCFGTGMASWRLLPEWIFTVSFCIWGIWEVGKCISSYLARHQVNIWAAWIVKKLWGLHHIVEIHLLCKNIRWIWNNQSSPFVYRKNVSKNTNKCNLNKSFSPCLGSCCSKADECWIDPANKCCTSFREIKCTHCIATEWTPWENSRVLWKVVKDYFFLRHLLHPRIRRQFNLKTKGLSKNVKIVETPDKEFIWKAWANLITNTFLLPTQITLS